MYETDRTRYVGNHVKVGGLISGMPNPAGVAIQGMERQTTARPYGVTIYYGAEDAAGGAAAVEAGRETFRRNAVLLLSLIDNVDWIAYSPADDAERQDDEANVYIWTREQLNQWFREDVRNLVADEAGLSIDRSRGPSSAAARLIRRRLAVRARGPNMKSVCCRIASATDAFFFSR